MGGLNLGIGTFKLLDEGCNVKALINLHNHRPINESEERVTPSDLEIYRHANHNIFRAPGCFCAVIDSVAFVESEFFLAGVDAGEHSGEYGMHCRNNRCGYVVYLERFYS